MIIDTSAILAILFQEADAERYANAIAGAESRRMSAASFLEAGIVVDNQLGAAAGRQLDALVARADIGIEPVTREQAVIARQAYLDYGKGRYPAKLNFGDCFSYALAKTTGMPLLFKGEDFSKTDLSAV
ncbi:type II toxin-antitoxin system VapC family toxin [Thiohalocapsa sp. ML1]|uniref:type II toxin-antitoxin system VapC family toxin n=1 Tax=Thiohalocapsa sp. ML1 TaxID=1431688 RepID=UPI000731F081|nr:type II toxin-antitoxin system VapC family toxin [Thiohalocapsa sp. ML1]